MSANEKSKQQKKSNRQVQVVKCPSAFPVSSSSRKRPRDAGAAFSNDTSNNPRHHNPGRNGASAKKNQSSELLDWHDTAKEIRAYASAAFTGKQKRDYEDEQYFMLTGRHKKKQKVPLPIVRGIKKAAAQREAKAREEARQAGIVIPKATKETKKSDAAYRVHGPAPSIGFVKQGVYRVSNNNANKKKRR
mmetsp:Transcript_20536/g.33018  ORF Transcript_20536/g.33018 Transcript_20536/m.33018 type:complete len:190 (+) Transcript_20536:83-652(+)